MYIVHYSKIVERRVLFNIIIKKFIFIHNERESKSPQRTPASK